MSLTKLLKAPIKLFRKEVITFLVIHRHDLGILEEKLRYIAVKPMASVCMLRRKIWYLLDLPDYCEEVIILKYKDVEIPLTDLRKGNDPQHPFLLEVWLPGKRMITSTTVYKNMLTIGNEENRTTSDVTANDEKMYEQNNKECAEYLNPLSAISKDTMAKHKQRFPEPRLSNNLNFADYKKSDLTCRISTSSIFRLQRRKSRDNFTNILLKIQSDLSTLSNKLSYLETRIHT
ncbi:hypothetical protein K1T71_001217 [Dendrolimus kikuchii]|uniref:Uncharacterized protein n=1 Tax=Dendrolimus kikuchii TaxID=765133 RepID=A0ACC1DIN5_9NEOP|nr:hypothetical protein K1T71_001217 [Dendrolimus kikuchii]